MSNSDDPINEFYKEREEYLQRREYMDWFNSLPENEQKRIEDDEITRLQKASKKEKLMALAEGVAWSAKDLITEALEMEDCYKKYLFLARGVILRSIVLGQYENIKDLYEELLKKFLDYEFLEDDIEKFYFLFSIEEYNKRLKAKDLLFNEIKKSVLDLFYKECELKE